MKIHDSPRSLPDHRTNGYTLPTRVQGHLPTDLLGRKQPLLAGSQQECRVVDRRSGHDFAATRIALRRPLNLIRSHFSCIRFPPNGFAVFLTLFSKYFSPFPHGTCSLSVSCRYLALDGVYHPLWAAFPNNPTLRRRKRPFPSVSRTGLSPSPTCLSRSTSTATVGATPPLPATILWQHLPGISGSSCSRFARRYWGNPC